MSFTRATRYTVSSLVAIAIVTLFAAPAMAQQPSGPAAVEVPAGGGGFLRSPTSDEVIAWSLP